MVYVAKCNYYFSFYVFMYVCMLFVPELCVILVHASIATRNYAIERVLGLSKFDEG